MTPGQAIYSPYCCAGYTLDIPAFDAMFRAYNPERNGQASTNLPHTTAEHEILKLPASKSVTYEELDLKLSWCVQMDLTCFIAMMIFLQSANATFTAFAQGGNQITLDYNQFLYATANVV